MNTELQRLRDEAERRSILAAEAGDRDTADAWEAVGMAIDTAIRTTKHDFAVIAARAGLFPAATPGGIA